MFRAGKSFRKQYEGVPEKGYTQIIRKLLKDCDVYLNTDYNSLRKEKPDIAEKVFYTGRLDEYFGEEYGRLVYEFHSYETELQVSEALPEAHAGESPGKKYSDHRA
ncbi:MAG: UDP-galactopyranose mutase [Ruminococcus sp.]